MTGGCGPKGSGSSPYVVDLIGHRRIERARTSRDQCAGWSEKLQMRGRQGRLDLAPPTPTLGEGLSMPCSFGSADPVAQVACPDICANAADQSDPTSNSGADQPTSGARFPLPNHCGHQDPHRPADPDEVYAEHQSDRRTRSLAQHHRDTEPSHNRRTIRKVFRPAILPASHRRPGCRRGPLPDSASEPEPAADGGHGRRTMPQANFRSL